MASTIPLNIYAGNFPLNYQDTRYNTYKALLRRMRASIEGSGTSTGNALPGFVGTSTPPYNQGPWFVSLGFGLSHWRAWDDSVGAYAHTDKRVSFGGFEALFQRKIDSSVISNVIKVPDASGTLQMALDTFVPRATIILTGTTPEIKWTATDPFDGTASNDFLQRLTGNTTYSFSTGASAPVDGQVITVTVENNGTAYTVTWPVSVHWHGTHTQPVGSAGITAVGIYTFRKINGIIYGDLLNRTPGLPNPTVPTGGTKDAPPGYGPPDDNKFPY